MSRAKGRAPNPADKYIGCRVRAKRAGYTLPLEGLVTKNDIIERPEYENWDLEGELEVLDIPGGAYHHPIKEYLVGGQSADPDTIEPVEEDAPG